MGWPQQSLRMPRRQVVDSFHQFLPPLLCTCLPPFRRASVILCMARFALLPNAMLSRPAHSMYHVSYRLVFIARPRDEHDLDMIFLFFYMEHFHFQYVSRLTFLRCLFIPIDDILSTSTLYLLFFMVLLFCSLLSLWILIFVYNSWTLNIKWLRGIL